MGLGHMGLGQTKTGFLESPLGSQSDILQVLMSGVFQFASGYLEQQAERRGSNSDLVRLRDKEYTDYNELPKLYPILFDKVKYFYNLIWFSLHFIRFRNEELIIKMFRSESLVDACVFDYLAGLHVDSLSSQCYSGYNYLSICKRLVGIGR